ncbi:Phosphatidylinositol-4-phosphate 5-kinase [Pleurotus pulmonarius]|nr:Phosphatidylinositol-4-phosphate 5-kinase [Pleurotus pulmonarius]
MDPSNQQLTPSEVHVVKVTHDVVEISAGPADASHLIANKFGNAISRVVHRQELNDVPYYPPSPPASDEGQESIPNTPTTQVMFEEPEAMTQPADAPSRPSTALRAGTMPANGVLQRSSTDVHLTQRVTATHTVIEKDTFLVGTSKQSAHVSVDGYLHPPPPSISISTPRDGAPLSIGSTKPARRNTTGSLRPQHGSYPSASHIHFSTTGDGELASDIQMAAEQIRRERANKRVKAQQKEEMERERDARAREDAPLVGNLIGKDHVNYVLMYNMLTGIRIGVSRCQAKIKRPLTDDDFTARHKFSFDIVGNELTPSTTYDFKFKDYAPWVFRTLREDIFHMDPADYLLSLTSKYILSELGSPGKSGSFFYFSRDYRFIIKTIRKEEATFLRNVLKQYYEHVKTNPHTLISRFYGLHRVKLPRGKKIHFVIMNNLFPPHRDIHETYDLKGSTVGRYYPEEKLQQNPRAVLKDVNWIKRGRQLELGPEKRALLEEQLRRDKEFLKEVNVMDYSLLVGIHDVKRGNTEGVRSETLKVFSPDLPKPRRSMHAPKDAEAMRRAMNASDPKRLGKGKGTIRLPEKDTGDTQREGFLFYQDEGGLRATDDNNEVLGESSDDPDGKIYYLGIIDILTPYGVRKKLEHFWKGLKDDRHKISPVPAAEYADRFFSFMKAIMRGGVGGAAFMTEKERDTMKEKTE